MIRIHKYYRIVLLTFLFTSCIGENGALRGIAEFPLPLALVDASLPDDSLNGKLTIGKEQYAIQISDNIVTVDVSHLPEGTYQTTLIFNYTSDVHTNGIALVQATKNVNADEIENSLVFFESDFTYPDDDSDEVSNLDEIINGTDPKSSGEIPLSYTWATKTPMPTARREHATVEVNGKIYVIGGTTGITSTPLNTVEVYDPAIDSWTTKTPMPTARWAIEGSGVVNGKIYVIGGINGSGLLDTVDVFQ